MKTKHSITDTGECATGCTRCNKLEATKRRYQITHTSVGITMLLEYAANLEESLEEEKIMAPVYYKISNNRE